MRALPCLLVLSSAGSATAQSADPGLASDTSDEVGVAIAISGALGWVDMGQFNEGVDAYFAQLDTQVEGFEATPQAGHMIRTLGLRVQLRLPRFITIETGIDYLSQGEATAISIGASDGEISYTNHSVSLPLLMGAHIPVAKRIAVHGGIGPLLIIAGRSRWDYSFGQVSSFAGDVGGGLEAAAGVEVAIVWRLRAAATARYRFAKSGDLTTDGAELPPLQPVTELGWSGAAAELGLRIVLD